MRYLRHEAGHAVNYAFLLHDRPDWRSVFGSYARPYKDRYRADPFSRSHVRHILGWYAQKHPDEDFAETFAVWLTPGLDWRHEYEGWPALVKLEYMDQLMREIAHETRDVPAPVEDDLPVGAMRNTVADHYASDEAMSSEPPSVVRSLIDHVSSRARELDLRVGALEASTLIELTAFGTAVAMQYRENRRERKRWRPAE